MGFRAPRLTASQRVRLLWGKVRRFYLGVLRRRYVRRSLELRRGECARCGACCALGYRCWSLRDSDDGTECRVHGVRPMNCRIFPIDERDLADRDLLNPSVPCGFSFDGSSPPDPPSTEDPTDG